MRRATSIVSLPSAHEQSSIYYATTRNISIGMGFYNRILLKWTVLPSYLNALLCQAMRLRMWYFLHELLRLTNVSAHFL